MEITRQLRVAIAFSVSFVYIRLMELSLPSIILTIVEVSSSILVWTL